MAAVPINAFFVVYRSWHQRQVSSCCRCTGVYLLRVSMLLAIYYCRCRCRCYGGVVDTVDKLKTDRH